MHDDGVPPPPDGAGDRPQWASDPKAEAEQRHWADEQELRGARLNNDLMWTKAYGLIVVTMMVVFTGAFCLSLLAWLAHYITPVSWLTPEQLSKIQSVIFSGSLGALVSAYAKKHIDRLGN